MSTQPDVALFIDPFSHHFRRDRLFDVSSARLSGDHILAPYAALREWFAERGVPVYTADRLIHGEVRGRHNIYLSLGIREHYRRLARRPDVVLSAFFAAECPIADPELYRELPAIQRRFRRVFSFSDRESLRPFVPEAVEVSSFRLPQAFHAVHETLWQGEQRSFLVMINANKLPRLRVQELYTERLRAVAYFAGTGEVDLYGVGWDGPPYRLGGQTMPGSIRRLQRNVLMVWNRYRPGPLLAAARSAYRGPAVSKAETLSRYTFALAFENMVLKGWITEKIFDCFFAGTIPVYLGAPDITDHVPRDCFIDMREFAGYADLRRYLKALSPRAIRMSKERARDFVSSPQFQPFSTEAFVELVAGIVQADAGLRLEGTRSLPAAAGERGA